MNALSRGHMGSAGGSNPWGSDEPLPLGAPTADEEDAAGPADAANAADAAGPTDEESSVMADELSDDESCVDPDKVREDLEARAEQDKKLKQMTTYFNHIEN